MGNNDRQQHISLLQETGRHRLTKEQLAIIAAVEGDMDIELTFEGQELDTSCTMDLPILGEKRKK